MAERVRFYLKRVTEFAAHGLEPVEYQHIEVEVPALAAILRSKKDYPWFVVGVELVEERDNDDKAALAEAEKATSGKQEGWADGS